MNEELLQNRPVRSLQTMLRVLSFYYPAIPRLIPDGVFGERTLEAVMVFQRTFALPVTGTVDNGVWDAVVLAYTAASGRMAPPLGAAALPDWRFTVSPGQQSVYLHLMQAVFLSLSSVLEEITPCPVNGSNTGACTRNVRWLQRKAGLRETGIAGKAEWDFLTRLHTVFVLRARRT